MTDAQLSAPQPQKQEFHEVEANAQFPEGCKCGNNGGGDCDWCQVYYGSEEPNANSRN